MVEEKVEVVVAAVDLHALLPFDEAEADTDLKDESLDLAQDGRLEIVLAVGVLQPEEVQHIRVAEDEVRRKLVVIAKFLQLRGDQTVRLFRQRCSLEEHGLDPSMECPNAPLLDAAHLRIKLALQGIIDIDEAAEMRPTQFCTQCVQDVRVGKHLGTANHVGQIPLRVSAAELLSQLSTQ